MKNNGSTYAELQAEYQKMGYKSAHNHYYRTYQVKNGILAVGCLSEPLRKKMADTLQIEDIRFEEGYDPYSDLSLIHI